MDKLTPELRSENMSRIRSKHSVPERVVRSLVHSMGYRFRLHSKHLPGQPDLTFPGRRCVIFVHGCFWHQHKGCREGRLPGSRTDYWSPKLNGNVLRDRKRAAQLRRLGWRVMIVWECQIENPHLPSRIRRFLGKPGVHGGDDPA